MISIPNSNMGLSNSGAVLTEKDLNSIGFNFLTKPTLDLELELEFHDHHEDDQCLNCEKEKEDEKEQDEDKCKEKVAATTITMELKISSLREFKVEEGDDDDDNDGFKTPTSLDHKIPLMISCPPAPRKPKSLPSTKRRAPAAPNRRVLLDLSNEIQSLFPPDFCIKSKRVRKGGK